METWLILAIISAFIAGFQNFGMKIIAKRNYSTALASIISYSVGAVISGIFYFTIHGNELLIEGFGMILFLTILHRIVIYSSTLARVEGLKNIDTTIFFPLYKTFFPILMTATGVFYFGENITFIEGLGILIGIIIPLLLITKSENILQKNLKSGIFFVLLTTLTASLASIIAKMISEKGLNIELFIFLGFAIGILISSLNYHSRKASVSKKNHRTKGIYGFGILLGCLAFFGSYTFIHAIAGNLAIAVTINSFSILIPIILSVIFYKEEMTYKKAFVIFLSIVSVILFI